MIPEENDKEYLQIILDPIQVSARYKPRFGRGNRGGGLSLGEFQDLYQNDLFYSWFGLDSPLVYSAHKAAGGITSIYRQIGIGCERLFRRILQDALGLTEEETKWSYKVSVPGRRDRRLHLDARVILNGIKDTDNRKRFHRWMQQSADLVDIDQGVLENLKGVVFEVRQGYKSKDSKRQNADIANAAAAYANAYLPCIAVLSAQIDEDIIFRYRSEKWSIITGITGAETTPLVSTYDFLENVVGYDLAAFFRRNKETLAREVDDVLRKLLKES